MLGISSMTFEEFHSNRLMNEAITTDKSTGEDVLDYSKWMTLILLPSEIKKSEYLYNK